MKKGNQDNRDKWWKGIEGEIQRRGKLKDPQFKLSGSWKKLVRKHEGFKIYLVDGRWVRNNLSVIFGHGGHGLVHEFIPRDEIWVSGIHFHESEWSNCKCKDKNGKLIEDKRKISDEYFESTAKHEINEFKEMMKGKDFWEAHQTALKKEIELGLKDDPYTD